VLQQCAIVDNRLGLLQRFSRGIRLESNRRNPAHDDLSTLIDRAPLAVYCLDREGRVTSWNPTAQDLFGWSADEVRGKPLPTLKTNEIEACWPPQVGGQLAQPPFNRPDAPEPVITPESVIFDAVRLTREGGTIDVSIAMAPLLSDERTPHGFICMAQDISDRVRLVRELAESEAKYRALVETTATGYLIADPEGFVLDANDEYARMAGFQSPEDVIGRSFLEWTAPHDRERNAGYLEALADKSPLRQARVDYLDPHGNTIPIEFSATQITLAGRPLVVALCQDISERRREQEELQRKEQELREAQKMDAVGRLAGGMAHDFNNLLTAIGGYCDLLSTSGHVDPVGEVDLREIKQAAEQAASLTRHLLALSGHQVLRTTAVDIPAFIAGMEGLLLALMGEDVRLELNVVRSHQPLLAQADPHQLERAILSVAANARDAMPRGGTFSLHVQRGEESDACPAHQGETAARYVEIRLTDDGMGMEPDVVAHIFEPFFTTKKVHERTGLGLSTAYGIIAQMAGEIVCTSTPGVGTTFTVRLPLIQAGRDVIDSHRQLALTVDRRSPIRVLIAEDETSVRRLATRVLSRHGYAVLEAGDGQEALRRDEAERGGIDLLVTDVVMPGMNGVELAKRLGARYPKLRVLFISGYTQGVIDDYADLNGHHGFLGKPFSTAEFINKVEELLQE